MPTASEPDIVTLAKGLGGGLPIGACIAFGTSAACSGRSHGTTFCATRSAEAAALAVIGPSRTKDLLDTSIAWVSRAAARRLPELR